MELKPALHAENNTGADLLIVLNGIETEPHFFSFILAILLIVLNGIETYRTRKGDRAVDYF